MSKSNLVQFNGQTPQEARENGKKGGLASGVSRQRKKLLRELFNELLPLEVTEPELRELLESAGLEPTHEAAVCLAAVKRAEKGDIEAARFIRDTRGEKPVDGLAIGNLIENPVRAMDLTQMSDAELEALAEMCEERDRLPAE